MCLAALPARARGAAPPPGAQAKLDAASVAAAEETATLLRVTHPGRFTLAAHSATGAALQLVDMLAGPGAPAGAAGAQDGRLDELLDTGTYKLRIFAAKGARGSVALTVAPFTDAAPPRALPLPGTLFEADLTDGRQRSFWLAVPADGRVRIAATGRSLADLRLWRDGRDLVALTPSAEVVQPVAGHAMTALRLEGTVEPGTYLLTAYGGLPATWSDGAAAQPFYLRTGESHALESGWAGGAISADGTEIFTVPKRAAALRLDLPRSAAATLSVGDNVAALDGRSREPSVVLRLAPGAPGRKAELRAAAGQPYQLRVIESLGADRVNPPPGDYWVSANTLGVGGDEVPPTLLLVRDGGPQSNRIVGDSVPHVGPGLAWRAKFNLRGPTQLLVQADQPGELALTGTGAALDRHFDPRAYYDLPADIYWLALVTKPGALGAVDITFGPPGLQPAPTPALPPDPVISFGAQSLAVGQGLRLETMDAPGAETGLVARRLPVALADTPLTLTQLPGQAVDVPVVLPQDATLTAHAMGETAALDVRLSVLGGPRLGAAESVIIPAPAAARTVVLGIAPPPAAAPAVPPPRPLARVPVIGAGRPAFLDLATGASRTYALHVAQGGLYQLETLGRLKTAGLIGTSFIPELGQAEANGAGQNFLLQPWLRAGDYRVTVTARAGTGHLGIQAVPATLLPAPPLLAGGSVRATLAAGAGLAIPVTVTEAGAYDITLLGQGGGFSARLDDSDGWPLVVPGPFDDRVLDLRPGHFTLLVTPGPTQQRLVATMNRIVPPQPVTGHGPHPLPLGDTLSATWREPALATAPRTPDQYSFTLAGPATAHVRLGKGMEGNLAGPDGAAHHFAESWDGMLPAGAWALSTRAQGRNDRLDYTIELTTDELQPARPRTLDLPSHSDFTLAAPRIVTLTTSGLAPTRAVLRAADGTVLARAGARENDWNTALSRRLPAGSYRVELAPGIPPAVAPVAARPEPRQRAADESGPGTDDEEGQGPEQPQPDQPDMGDAANDGANTGMPAEGGPEGGPEAGPERDRGNGDDTGGPHTTLRLDLPAELPAVPAPASESALSGAGVHVLSVPPVPDGALLVASAHGAGTTMLALEHQDQAGAWRTVTQMRGAAPVAAAMGDSDTRPWRAVTWSLDGDAVPVIAAARVVTQAPAARLDKLAGMPVAVARLGLSQAAVSTVAGPPGLLSASWPGHGAVALQQGIVIPQGTTLWLVGAAAAPVAALPLAATAFTIDISAGAVAAMPGAPAPPGHLRFWRADSGEGQPAWSQAASANAIAPLSAVVAPATSLLLSDAGRTGTDAAPMRVRVRAIDAAFLPARPLETARAVHLRPGQALPVTAVPADSDLSVSLSPGLAAFTAGPDGAHGVWAPVDPITRLLPRTSDILLVNLGDVPGVAGLSSLPHTLPPILPAGTVMKRFFGAAGAFDITATVPAAGALAVAGSASLMVHDAAGAVLTGTLVHPAPGPASITVMHEAGPVALSLEAPARPAWITPSPVTAALPGTLTLAGDAMAVQVPADGPVLLHATTSAPVLLGLPGAPPELFASGAEFHRAVSGPVTLRIFSPQDGPLSGTLSLWAEKLRPAHEGLGETVAVPPGGSAAFSFELNHAARVGLGIRANPDSATVRLLDAAGRVVGQGVAQLRDLAAGRYVIEARVPVDAPPTLVRAALVGTVKRPNGPPADVVADYLELAGLKPK